MKAAKNFDKGNVHASFNRNLYNNRAETLTIDNPFQWFDALRRDTRSRGGRASRARWITAPDNEASTTNLGFLLQFARQTRIGGDFSMGKWTQNAPFYPYTINSGALTPSGARADNPGRAAAPVLRRQDRHPDPQPHLLLGRPAERFSSPRVVPEL